MTIIDSRSSNLLDIALLVLASAGFDNFRFTSRNETDIVVAENAYYVLAITQVSDLTTLPAFDEELASFLIDSARSTELRAKRWDLYAVLMSERFAPDQEPMTVTLSELRQDTHSVRRIVRSGIEPTLDGVEHALTTFLPLKSFGDEVALEDPLGHLQRLLPTHGIPESVATRAIAAFRVTGQVNDV